jgi:hypothetical protein
LWLALALCACNAKTTPERDSQSHWLDRCESSAECGGDAQCLCGVCSRPCSAQSECGGAAEVEARCTELSAIGAECADQGENRICLPRCDGERGCDVFGAGLSCVSGVCVAVRESSSAGAGGAADGGSAGRSSTGNAGRSATGVAGSGSAGRAGDAAVDAGMRDGSVMDMMCGAFVPEVTASPATVRLANATNENLFLGLPVMGCSEDFRFSIEAEEGVVLAPRLAYCGFSCEQLQTGQCAICPPACPFNPVVMLAPGGSFDVAWPGSVVTLETMPAACIDEGCLPARPCAVERTPPETLTFKAVAYPGANCGVNACPLCTPQGSGSCMLPDALTTTGTARTVSATWSRGQPMVTLTF